MARRKNRFVAGVRGCLLVGCWIGAGCALVGGPGSTGDGATPANKFRAELSDGAFRAVVEYEDDDGRDTLDIVVTGGTPGATVDISIAGVLIASVMLDENGSGRVGFSGSPSGPGEQPLPANFDPPDAGDAVTVGGLSGSFDSVELELEAELEAGAFRAEVEYEVESDETDLKVEVHGGEPNAVLAVTADGFAVGSLTLDALGAGGAKWSTDADDEEQPLPTGLPQLAAGDVVAVGTLSGALRAEDDDGDDDDGDDDEAEDDDAADNDNVGDENSNATDNSAEDNVNANDNGADDDNENDNVADDNGNDNVADDNENDNVDDDNLNGP